MKNRLLAWLLIGLSMTTGAGWHFGRMNKRLAIEDYTEISPDGCYKLVGLTPRWLLPSFFHPKPDPGDARAPDIWFSGWELPRFFRLYDHRSGRLLNETRVYDVATALTFEWPWYRATQGRLSRGLIDLGPALPNCSGKAPTRSR